MGWDGMDLSQTTTTTRAPLAVLTNNYSMCYSLSSFCFFFFWVACPTLLEAERLEEEGHHGLLSQPTAHQTKSPKYVKL